jgi:hypothetical protein
MFLGEPARCRGTEPSHRRTSSALPAENTPPLFPAAPTRSGPLSLQFLRSIEPNDRRSARFRYQNPVRARDLGTSPTRPSVTPAAASTTEATDTTAAELNTPTERCDSASQTTTHDVSARLAAKTVPRPETLVWPKSPTNVSTGPERRRPTMAADEPLRVTSFARANQPKPTDIDGPGRRLGTELSTNSACSPRRARSHEPPSAQPRHSLANLRRPTADSHRNRTSGRLAGSPSEIRTD